MSYELNKMPAPAKNPHNSHLANVQSFQNTKNHKDLLNINRNTETVLNNKLFSPFYRSARSIKTNVSTLRFYSKSEFETFHIHTIVTDDDSGLSEQI